jgi:hypothetical protein
MGDQQALYRAIKPDIELVAPRLFDLSKRFLQLQADFLPHAAILTPDSKVALVAAQGERELTNATEILPILHGTLRHLAKNKEISAIGVAESVTITPEGRSPTRAIKVLLEHRRGIAIALYMTYEKKFLRGNVFAPIFSVLANSEVNAW